MKREPQVFSWSSKNGLLEIVGRKDSAMEGTKLVFDVQEYPTAIRTAILDAGMKAIYQQRSSQVESDVEKIGYWQDLNEQFIAGTWEAEGGARGAPVVGAWLEALASVKKCSVGDLQKHLAGYSKEQRTELRTKVEAKYGKEIEAIKASRGKKEIDLSEV
jgi:hypothetical protein